MVCKGPYSCKSHWRVWACPSQVLSPTQLNITWCGKSPFGLEKPSYWQQYQSLNSALFLKYFVPESVYFPYLSIIAHYWGDITLQERWVFLPCNLYLLQKIQHLLVWILCLVLSLRGQARLLIWFNSKCSIEMPTS